MMSQRPRAGRRWGALVAPLALVPLAIAFTGAPDARAELGAVRERLHTYLEALSTREGQRGVYEQMYAELESRVGARDTEVSAQSARADRLVGELETLRGELEERLRAEAALRAQLEARAAAELAVAEKIKALEHQAADHGEVLRGLREELTRSQARTQELEADLRAAEETIHSQEADVRARSAQHEELLREQKGLRTLLEEARTAVEQRDARIRSLEASAVKSHAALDHIQQSMQRLDPLAVTGVDPPVESAARLLVRKDGDVEVVHVLGRRTTVGRTSENDLQIDTKFISRHHAVLLCGPVYTIIEDLNSTNGVLVNNQRVTRHTLKDGDAVMIGKTQFRFVVRPTSTRN
jgi:myosin heavy subunit